MKQKLKLRTKIEFVSIVIVFLTGTMFYAFLTGVTLPTLYAGFIGEDVATYNCQVSGHSNCLGNPNSKTCMSGYTDNGAGTCVLVKTNNPPASSVGTASCPYGTVKDSNGQCVGSVATTGACGAGQINVGGYCVSSGVAKYGEIPATSGNTPIDPTTGKPTVCTFTYNLVAMALSGSATVCNPKSGDTSTAITDFNNGIHCGVGYHWVAGTGNIAGQCVKDNAPTGSGGGGTTTNTSQACTTAQIQNGYYNDANLVCQPPTDTNPPTGTGAGGTGSCVNVDPTTGNCLDNQTPFGSGGSPSTGSGGGTGSSDSVNQLAQLLAQYIAQNQQTNAQPKQDPLSAFISQNPLTVMFITVAIVATIVITSIFRKKK